MKKYNKTLKRDIILLWSGSLILPPACWLANNWFLDLWGADEIIQVIFNPLRIVYFIIHIAASYITLNYCFDIIKKFENKKSEPHNQKAQAAAAYLPKIFLFMILIYCIIMPNIGIHSKGSIISTQYTLGELLGIPVIAIFSIPFLLYC